MHMRGAACCPPGYVAICRPCLPAAGTSELEAAAQVAVRGLRGVQQGLNNFTLDGHTGHSKQLDLSDLYTQDTVLWRSAPLEFGEHSVTVTCTGQPGKYTTSRNGLSVAGFLVMTDPNVIQQCEGFDSGHCLI